MHRDVRAGKRSMDGCLRYAIHPWRRAPLSRAGALLPRKESNPRRGTARKKTWVVRQSEQAARGVGDRLRSSRAGALLQEPRLGTAWKKTGMSYLGVP